MRFWRIINVFYKIYQIPTMYAAFQKHNLLYIRVTCMKATFQMPFVGLIEFVLTVRM